MQPIKIAVIGSGIAGLTAAAELSGDSRFRVVLIERAAKLGLESQCVVYPTPHGTNVVADAPPRMFNAALWPTLSKLLSSLNVATEHVDASQAFCKVNGSDQRTCYLHVQNGYSPKFRLRGWASRIGRSIARDARRLQSQGRDDLRSDRLGSLTIHEYLQRTGYSTAFIDQFLYPTLSSTVCTCSYESLQRYPAKVILNALDALTSGEPLRRISGGTRALSGALASTIDELRVATDVVSIHETSNGVKLELSRGPSEFFDHVIVATQANTASRLLQDISQCERDLLKSIPYEDIPVCVHQDPSWMPGQRSKWSTFNMSTEPIDKPSDRAGTCTVWMNRFHQNWNCDSDLFQTIGPISGIPRDMLAAFTLQRPIVNRSSQSAVKAIQELQADDANRKISYVGSWMTDGVPLLESGVTSALSCTKRIQSQAQLSHVGSR